MLIHNHLTPGKWAKGELQLPNVKKSFDRWHKMLDGEGWNLIYWHNHDHPRVLSHYGSEEHRKMSGTMLCYTLYLMPGTPIVYQGEEIGMTNVDYQELKDFRDVEVYTEYNNFMGFGASHEVAMQALRDRSRDNARNPFQWDSSSYGGFSKVTPWMNVNRNYTVINLENEQADKSSIYNTYKNVFKIRKDFNVSDGKMDFIDLENNDSYVYTNEVDGKTLLVVANFKGHDITVDLDIELDGFTYFMGNSKERNVSKEMVLAPFETVVYLKK